MRIVYKKTGSLRERDLEVSRYCYPLPGYSNYYAHCFFVYKPKFSRLWHIEAGCKQDGWAIHAEYGYYSHGIVKVYSCDIDETDLAEKIFEQLTKIARKEGLNICWD